MYIYMCVCIFLQICYISQEYENQYENTHCAQPAVYLINWDGSCWPANGEQNELLAAPPTSVVTMDFTGIWSTLLPATAAGQSVGGREKKLNKSQKPRRQQKKKGSVNAISQCHQFILWHGPSCFPCLS